MHCTGAYIVVDDGFKEEIEVESGQKKNWVGAVGDRREDTTQSCHVCKRCDEKARRVDGLQLRMAEPKHCMQDNILQINMFKRSILQINTSNYFWNVSFSFIKLSSVLS